MCLAILSVSVVWGQSSFKPGYIILNSSDTVRGEIEYGNWAINPETISFRNAGTQQSYTVSLLKGFEITNEAQFVRFHLSYQLSAATLADALESFDGPVVTKDAWLRLLYKSKYSLYELNTPKRKYFFVQSDRDGLKELIYRVRLSGGALQADEQYKNLLALYASENNDSPNFQKQLEASGYVDKELIHLFDLLNNGKNSFKESGQTHSSFDISAGGAFYSISASGYQYNDGSAYAINTADFNGSLGFIAGCGFTFSPKKNRGRLHSRLGLNIGSLSLKGENNTSDGSFDKETYRGSLLFAEVNTSLDFLITSGKRTDFFLGLFAGYNLIVSNNLSSTFENPGVVGVVVNRDKFPPVSGGFIKGGINATASGSWGRLSLGLNGTSNILNSSVTVLRAKGLSLTYGYFLKK